MSAPHKSPGRVFIGTRGSQLALYQANSIKALLERLHPGLEVGLVKIKTTGDKITDVPLAKVGGKGLFVKEIEEALLRGEIDLAVHSMKDVPVALPAGLHLTAITRREDPRDVLISRVASGFRDLPVGGVLGTSSLRRQAQLRHNRPDLRIQSLRGNLDTRLRKLDEGSMAAIVLAAAGVKRLGWEARITEYLDPSICLPAIGQGALGLECRVDDERINALLAPLNHPESARCVRAERSFLTRLEGGCQVPIAAHARLEGDRILLDGLVAGVDGNRVIRDRIQGQAQDGEALGIQLAERLLSLGAAEILKEIYQSASGGGMSEPAPP
jgi:hydroxymethylbilane synthase